MYNPYEGIDPLSQYEKKQEKNARPFCTPAILNNVLITPDIETKFDLKNGVSRRETVPKKILLHNGLNPYFYFIENKYGFLTFKTLLSLYYTDSELMPIEKHITYELYNSIPKELPFRPAISNSFLSLKDWLSYIPNMTFEVRQKIDSHCYDRNASIIDLRCLHHSGTQYDIPAYETLANPNSFSIIYNQFIIQYTIRDDGQFYIECIVPSKYAINKHLHTNTKNTIIIEGEKRYSDTPHIVSNDLGQKLVFHNNTISLQNPSTHVDAQDMISLD
jgi:hypothetical protein